MIRYHTYEVYIESTATGLVRVRTVRAANAEQAERMVGRELPEEWRVIATVYQFNSKVRDSYANRVD